MSVEKFISLEKAQLAALTSQLDDLGDLLKQSKGDLALLLASTAPPPIGTAADVVSLGVSIGRGDWGGAFWDVIGLVPVVGDGVKGAVKGTKLAKKIADITAQIAKARKKIDNRTKNIRKNAQKKCDKLLGNTKKRKSDKDAATNGCTTNCGGRNKTLKKGEVDEYGNLKKKTGDGTIHRDHQPSKAALLKRAEKLKGSPLTKGEIKRINKEATAVNVPEDIHRAGPTYGGKNKDLIEPDSNDLAGATKRDSDAMVDNAKSMDTENVNVYEDAADNITKKDNAEYDDWLLDRLDE